MLLYGVHNVYLGVKKMGSEINVWKCKSTLFAGLCDAVIEIEIH